MEIRTRLYALTELRATLIIMALCGWRAEHGELPERLDVLAGEYHSVFKGRGMEFDEVREYQPGDDIRNIDWNVTARTGHPYVKRFINFSLSLLV